MKPGGTCTSSLVVLALSISLGTRMSSVALAPAGNTFGWKLTCACALAASRANTASDEIPPRINLFRIEDSFVK